MTSAEDNDAMIHNHYPYIVIGGGLSGLLVCRGLQQANRNCLLLEARSMLGGRLQNDNKHNLDMGGAWIWPEHQPHMRQLVQELGVETFPQPDDSSSTRIKGGAVQLIHKISAQLAPETIRLNAPVSACRQVNHDGESLIQVETSSHETFTCRQVIIAAPPRLIDQHITFYPPLSPFKQAALRNSHTWMAGVTKIALVYAQRFWSENASNTGLGDGPAFQVYDASTQNVSALTFFALATNAPDDKELAQQMASQMRRYWTRFGCGEAAQQAIDYSSYHVQRWPSEAYISEDSAPTTIHPHPMPVAALSKSEWNGSLLFAGSESDLVSPGVMEGAVGAARRVLKELGIV